MRTCFLTIDVEAREDDRSFEGVEKLDEMLKVFKKHNANATLFVTGEVLEKYSGLIKKWAKNYEIGCHNYYHVTLDKLEIVEREKQIKNFIELYKKILLEKPKGFRAPRNVINNEQFPILRAYGFLYDSSVLPRYPWPFQKYEGYKGRAPVKPYWPSKKNYKKRDPSTGLGVNVLEIPETPITFWGLPVLNIPLVATWLRKWGIGMFKFFFHCVRPKYINFNMHSWDGVKFKGKSSKNSGRPYLKQLDEMLGFLKRIGYEFKSGEQIAFDATNL